MKYLLGILLLSFTCCRLAQTQSVEKTDFAFKNAPGVSCVWVTPKTGAVKGVVMLIAGFGETAEGALTETRIPTALCERGMMAVVVGLGAHMYADSSVMATLDEVTAAVQERYHPECECMALGGFSIGGAIALRYAERCHEQPEQHPLLPNAVFAIDAPVDLIELWDYFEREIARNFDPVGVAEAKYVSELLKREIGTPAENRALYEALTPYCHSCQSPGNERFLKNTAVRVYHDMDLDWYLKNKKRSAYDCNFLNASAFIAQLLQTGNEQATFVSGKTGYRSDGTRNPHAWSIVDEQELAMWIDKMF
ncbi:MAG: hypothetical protein KDC65_14515 [Saprospiraceae bacterium]|nr:hypothetical protein [Saprospiraceae bacterium]